MINCLDDFNEIRGRSSGLTDHAEAQDYLLLKQSLWNTKEVRDWVSSKDEIMEKLLRPCRRAGCDNIEENINQFK